MRRPPPRLARLSGLLELPIAMGGSPPAEFRIFAAGWNEATFASGERARFLFDADAARSVMGFFAEKGSELCIDYEHMALSDPPMPAPAAGWFTPQIRDGALWATAIRWTPRAAAHLASAEYRYFSPAIDYDEKTGRVKKLINCALTNIPALNEIDSLVAASAKETPMNEIEKLQAQVAALTAQLAAKDEEMKALTAKLAATEKKDDDEEDEDEKKEKEEMMSAAGLSARAPRGERLAGISALAALRLHVRKLTGQETDAGALGVLSAWKADAADTAGLRADKARLEEETLRTEMKGILDGAVKAGKLPPALRESEEKGVLLMGAGKPSRDGIAWLSARWAAAAPVVAAAPTAQQPTGAGPLSDWETRMLKLGGTDPKAFAEWQAKKLTARP